MSIDDRLSQDEVAAAQERRLIGQKLQELEGNPLSAEEIAMFEMFERERWPHERRRAFILEQARAKAAVDAAE